jgi:hypothetical protein
MSRRRRKPTGSATLPWDTLYPTLDLHGDTADEARRRAERWLAEQQSLGVRTVRIITGKGLHSQGPPVLRGEIGALLRSLQGTRVAHYASEPGGGVFRIELRRSATAEKAVRPRPRVQPAHPPADAELRRLAEETLWDLGVQPTPELIAAELRRLKRSAADGGG